MSSRSLLRTPQRKHLPTASTPSSLNTPPSLAISPRDPSASHQQRPRHSLCGQQRRHGRQDTEETCANAMKHRTCGACCSCRLTARVLWRMYCWTCRLGSTCKNRLVVCISTVEQYAFYAQLRHSQCSVGHVLQPLEPSYSVPNTQSAGKQVTKRARSEGALGTWAHCSPIRSSIATINSRPRAV